MAKIKECWLADFLVSFTGGCAQMDHLLPNSLLSGTPKVPRASRPREVTYPLETSQPISPEHNQPEALAQFALGLAEKGEAAKAAAFFLEAADSEGADSRWNRFRIACVAAAATLYLEAGQIQHFNEAVARLRGEMDRFQIAASEPEIALLLAIDDKLAGRPVVISTQIPWPVRDLFREEIR